MCIYIDIHNYIDNYSHGTYPHHLARHDPDQDRQAMLGNLDQWARTSHD